MYDAEYKNKLKMSFMSCKILIFVHTIMNHDKQDINNRGNRKCRG